MEYRNANGSTGRLEGGVFVAFESQDEADKSMEPKPEPKRAAKKDADKEG